MWQQAGGVLGVLEFRNAWEALRGWRAWNVLTVLNLIQRVRKFGKLGKVGKFLNIGTSRTFGKLNFLAGSSESF